MRAILFLTAIATALGCHASPQGPVLESLMTVSRETGAAESEAWTHGEIVRLADRARRAAASGIPRTTALKQAVFDWGGFAREVDDTDLTFVLLPSVLRHRRGSCVGLGSLYLALGEALGWEVRGVTVPGHFFVRVGDEDGSHNVELLRRGEVMSDDWYRARFAAPEWNPSEHFRSLSLPEVRGIIEYDVGSERRRQNRLDDARRAYESAVRDFPALAEAHAGLGATLHLLGDLEAAEINYRAALRANPNLQGVSANVELLGEERQGSTSR